MCEPRGRKAAPVGVRLVTIVTAHRLFLCYGEFGRDASMDEYKLYREQRVPVGPNRLSHLTEVVTAVVFVLVAIYFLR